MSWFNRKDERLIPGDCECGHERCSHVKGKGRCMAQYPPDSECKEWSECACQLYIREDEGEDENESPTPSPEQLEESFQH